MSGHGPSTGLKLIIAAVVVIAILGAAFWAGSKALKKTATTSPSPSSPTQTQFTVSNNVSPIVNQTATVGNRPGNIAPDFRLENIKGGAVALSDYRGFKPVVLTIWKSDCTACTDMLSSFDRVQGRYGERYFTLLVNRAEARNIVQQYADRTTATGLRYLLDASDAIIHLFGASDVPYTVFIKSDGTIAQVYQGSLSEQQIEDSIKTIVQ